MDDESDVRLIDTEPKGFCRHNNVKFPLHEPLLSLLALFGLHLAVISSRIDVFGA